MKTKYPQKIRRKSSKQIDLRRFLLSQKDFKARLERLVG
jgi:hypothetical protein